MNTVIVERLPVTLMTLVKREPVLRGAEMVLPVVKMLNPAATV